MKTNEFPSKPLHEQLEAGVERALPNGRFLRLQLGQRDDEARFHRLAEALSVHTLSEVLYQSIRAPDAARLDDYLETKFPDRVTIFASFQSESTITRSQAADFIGLAHFWKTDPSSATMTLVVGDAWRGQGVGRTLLTELLSVAREAGVQTLRVFVPEGDIALKRLLQHCGQPLLPPVNDQAPWEIKLNEPEEEKWKPTR